MTNEALARKTAEKIEQHDWYAVHLSVTGEKGERELMEVLSSYVLSALNEAVKENAFEAGAKIIALHIPNVKNVQIPRLHKDIIKIIAGED